MYGVPTKPNCETVEAMPSARPLITVGKSSPANMYITVNVADEQSFASDGKRTPSHGIPGNENGSQYEASDGMSSGSSER